MSFDPSTLGDLYPFTSHYLDRGGIRMHYLDEGQGPPIVMVHGNPSWSFYYREAVKALRDRYRVVVPDHVGCGASDKPGDDRYNYTLESRVDDLEAVIDSLNLGDEITLMVHDWGGAIGMGFAARRPEAISRLVILNTSAFGLPDGKRVPFTLRLTRTPLGALLVRGGNAFARGAAAKGVVKPLAPAVKKGFLAPYDSWTNRIATLRFVQDIPLTPDAPARAMIDQIESAVPTFADRPALICWGEHDFVFDMDYLARWRELLPAADVHTFADAGHYVLEDAGDRIIPLVRDFLSRTASQESVS